MRSGAEMVRDALTASHKTQVELAAQMGWSKQNLNSRLKNDSLSFNEVVRMMAICGYEVKLLNADGEEPVEAEDTGSPRVSKMVDGVPYDTSKAESLCTSRSADDDEFFMELFKDVSGGYFVVYYELWEGGHHHISPVSREGAQKVWERLSGRPSDELK